MKNLNRRTFVKKSTVASAGVLLSTPFIKSSMAASNDTVNVAVIGIRGRGRAHYNALAKIPNVKIVAICDIDQNLLPKAVDDIEKLTGNKPATETEYRKILENKDIDAVSIATPNHWHALSTVWAAQAGLDWEIRKSPAQFIIGSEGHYIGELKEVPEKQVLYRSDTHAPLSVVSNRYKVVQPSEILEFYRDLIEVSGFQLENVGRWLGLRIISLE